MPHSGFKPEPTLLQAEFHIHHTDWATFLLVCCGIQERDVSAQELAERCGMKYLRSKYWYVYNGTHQQGFYIIAKVSVIFTVTLPILYQERQSWPWQPSDYGHELVAKVSWIRFLVPQKTRRAEEPMHVKSAKAQYPPVGVVS
ncbi:hypothetical protein TNCV_2132141 [Trichonephila clavipes]|nr:hypothetical protein TNCV_2132141 [Trichonephila clavipes]